MPFELKLERRLECGLCAVVSIPDHVDPDDPALKCLHEEELQRAAGLGKTKVGPRLAGRIALRRALRSAGWDHPGAVLEDERGCPALENGLQASISHKKDMAVALVAPMRAGRIGVDLEHLRKPAVDFSTKVLTPSERSENVAFGPEKRWKDSLRRFSLKESVYKALDPHVKRYVGFHEAEVWPRDDGTAKVFLLLPEARFEARGWWTDLDDGLVLTAAEVWAREEKRGAEAR